MIAAYIYLFKIYIEAVGSSGPRRDIGLDSVVIAECSHFRKYKEGTGQQYWGHWGPGSVITSP